LVMSANLEVTAERWSGCFIGIYTEWNTSRIETVPESIAALPRQW
jgi:hypothetical protein